jgi:hypothetical protein
MTDGIPKMGPRQAPGAARPIMMVGIRLRAGSGRTRPFVGYPA